MPQEEAYKWQTCVEIFFGNASSCGRNVNYRDLIQLGPEQVERTQLALRPMSECDNERMFGLVNKVQEEQRIRATMGLAEYERTLGEIWQALMPIRKMPGMHINEQKSYFTNFYFGACMDLELNWKKFFPEYWDIVLEKDIFRKFARQSVHPILKMKAVIINPKWERLVVCR